MLLFDDFQQLYDEVQHIMKEWEVLSGQGAPLKEKSDQLRDLVHLHERQRARIRDYEEILYKTIQFHQVKEEVSLTVVVRRLQDFTRLNSDVVIMH